MSIDRPDGATWVTYPPDTGAEMPTDAELAKLWKIVIAAYPELGNRSVTGDEFKRGFWAQSRFWRSDINRSRYFESWTDDACQLLRRHGASGVGSSALFAAMLAAGDIQWVAANSLTGQMLEVGLHPHSGRKCANAWRNILSGKAGLVPPTPPPRRLDADRAPPVRFYAKDPDGAFRFVGGDRALWR